MGTVDFTNPKNYKPCAKKMYDIHVCMPPIGTIVINKLEQADTVKHLGGRTYFTVAELRKMNTTAPNKIAILKQLASQGKIYVTSKGNPFVLCGTQGEMWTISPNKLASTYTFLQNNRPLPINEQTLKQRTHNGVLNWTVVRVSKQATMNQNFACFVPVAQKAQINVGWAVLNLNGSGVKHGKGDFMVCGKLQNGMPDIQNKYVVNGLVFGATYNNTGWSDCLANAGEVLTTTIAELPKLIREDTSSILDELYAILSKYKCNSAAQMPFNVQRVPEGIIIKSSVVEDYRKKAESAHASNSELTAAEQAKKFSNFITNIALSEDKQTVQFKSYNVFEDTKELAYCFDLPATEETLTKFTTPSSGYFFTGLLGWVPSGTQNNFRFVSKPTKFEFDGIHAYTVSSSGINRKLRFQEKSYERSGEECLRLHQCITGADRYFDKVQTIKPMIVYRGMDGNDAVTFSSADNKEHISGALIANAAYTSTSINLHSTLMFAKQLNKDPNDGVILAIQIPAGVHCDYIHNIAGWKEQFEVLLDRKYDIKADEEIFTFKGGRHFTYHVYKAELVPHAPFGEIPESVDVTGHEVEDAKHYDGVGRIRYEFDIRALNTVMKQTFAVLQKHGVSGLQYQPKVKFDAEHRDFVIAHQGISDDNKVTDLGFSYNEETGMIDVVKIISDESVVYSAIDPKTKKPIGVTNTSRSYWSDSNRNNGAIDKDYSWANYGLNGKGYDEEKETGGAKHYDIIPRSSVTVKLRPGEQIEDITVPNPGYIARSIANYLKYSKDITFLPLQEIARYFDVCFKNTIIDEGYELSDSIPVIRKGKPDDPNDGYVPLKYKIDGDNDDTLTLMMKLYRGESNRIQLEYRGRSNNQRVKEANKLRWNIFNQEVMEEECNKILYVFASKLNLNHTRKADKLIQYFARCRGYELTFDSVGSSKSNRVAYKKWSGSDSDIEHGRWNNYVLYRYIGSGASLHTIVHATFDRNSREYKFEVGSRGRDTYDWTPLCEFSIPYNIPIAAMYGEFASQWDSHNVDAQENVMTA